MDFRLLPENPLILVIESVNICNKNIKIFLKNLRKHIDIVYIRCYYKITKSKSNAAGGDSICLTKINLEQRSLKMD